MTFSDQTVTTFLGKWLGEPQEKSKPTFFTKALLRLVLIFRKFDLNGVGWIFVLERILTLLIRSVETVPGVGVSVPHTFEFDWKSTGLM